MQLQKKKNFQKQIEKPKFFISTYISALAARIPVLPLERLIILQQTNKMKKYQNYKGRTSNLNYLSNIVKKEGIKGIFKGNLTFICKIIPHTALEFYFFEIFKEKFLEKKKNYLEKKFFEIEKKEMDIIIKDEKKKNLENKFGIEKINFFSGCFAGLFSFMIMYPMDFCRIMVNLNKTPKNNIFPHQNLFFLYKKYGFKNLYKGSFIAGLSYFPYCGFKFAFFEFNKKFIYNFKNGITNKKQNNSKNKNNINFENNIKIKKLSILDKLLAGGLAGIFAQTLIYPLEILGKRRISQILENHTKNFTYKDLFVFMYKKGGLKEFRLGLMSNYQKVTIVNSIGFLINDLFKENLDMK